MSTEKKQEIKDFIEEKALRYGLILVGLILFAIVTITTSGGEKFNYEQNKAVEYEGAEYKIVKVEKTQNDLYEDYDDLKVTIKITNKSKEKIKYDKSHFFIANKDDEDITKATLATDDDNYLGSGTLKPGESVEGIVSWTIKKGAKDLRVRYFENIILTGKEVHKFQWLLDN